MRNNGVGSWTSRRARKTPDSVAVIHEGHQWTYRQLHERATGLAHGLRALGVTRGDRVAFLGPNHPAFLETLFATGMLGAVFVPLNTRLTGAELAHCLDDSGTSVLVHAPHPSLDTSGIAHRVALEAPDEGAHTYEEFLAAHGTEPIDEPVGLDDPCMIMYTSGTTGKAKGAVLTHGNITWNSINILIDVDLASDEVTLVVAPLFHTAGLNITCLPTLLKGGSVVLVPAFDPDRVLELIRTHRITYMFGVPTMYDALARSPLWKDADLSSVRQLNCGGSPVPQHTIRTYLERGLAFSQGYGMTEASPGVLYLPRSMSTTKAGTAGVPHFFTDARVVDPDGTPVSPGEKGEIVVSSPTVMSGYWGNPAETARVFDGGWFHTGDIGVSDEDGYVSIVDRVKELIISGGENIYPAEVEATLHQHPAVLDCAVIGVPHDKWGEVGHAVVVAGTRVTERELLEFLDGRIARYKIPKSIEFVDQLPRNPSGKILKKTLREQHKHD